MSQQKTNQGVERYISLDGSGYVQHYLATLQHSMRTKWNAPVLSDYQGDTFTFADIATRIAKLHFIFEKLGFKTRSITKYKEAHFLK